MVRMKIFLSSVISGMEEYRAAARQAAETLGHTVTAAEDFGASPLSPQQICLAGVRDADLVVLLLGERYGGSPGVRSVADARGVPGRAWCEAGAGLRADGREP